MKRLLIPIALFAILTAACTSGQSQGSEVSSETSTTEQSSAVESSEDAACIDEGGTYVVSGVAAADSATGQMFRVIPRQADMESDCRSPKP